MTVFYRTKATLADISNLHSNKRQMKETLRFSINISPTRIYLNIKFPVSTRNLESVLIS